MGKEKSEMKMDNNVQIISNMIEIIMLSMYQIKDLKNQKLSKTRYNNGDFNFLIASNSYYYYDGVVSKANNSENFVFMGDIADSDELKVGTFSIKSLKSKTFDATIVIDSEMYNFNFKLVNGEMEMINNSNATYKDDVAREEKGTQAFALGKAGLNL